MPLTDEEQILEIHREETDALAERLAPMGASYLDVLHVVAQLHEAVGETWRRKADQPMGRRS